MSVGIDQRISRHCLLLRNSIQMLKLSSVIRKSVRIFPLRVYTLQCQNVRNYLIRFATGVEMKFKHSVYPILIQPTQIKEIREIIETPEALKLGASVTLVELEETLKHYVKIKPGNIYI